LLLLSLSLPLPLASAANAAPKGLSAKLDDAVCCGHGRYHEALKLHAKLRERGEASPQDDYRAAYALVALFRFSEAANLLQAVRAGGFTGWPGWPTTETLQARVKAVQKLSPPPKPAPGVERVSVRLEKADAWSAPILAGLPELEKAGRRAFGAALPPVTLYLIPERPAYERFYAAFFAVDIPTAWQDGTGVNGAVLACGESRGGKVTRPHGDPETVSCVYHEFGHAWMSSYVRAKFDRDWTEPALRSPLLDEGVSDYVAALREPAFLERRREWVAEKAKAGAKPPAFEELLRYDAFYEKGEIDLHYWLSALLLKRLLGAEPSSIPKLLDAHVAAKGDAAAALKSATGKDARAEYARLVASFWPQTGKP
jgi:hypothetical protein